MSLLIKALASAEKDKQKAERSERAESLSSDAMSQLGRQSNHSKDIATSSGDVVFNDVGLSLTEEPSLLSSEVKLKEGVATKPSAQSTNNGIKQKSKADAFNEAAMASVASLKAQGSATKEGRQRVAASVFVANQAIKTVSSRSVLLLLGVAGGLMVFLGLQGYQYLQVLIADEVVVVKPVGPVGQVVNVETIGDSGVPDAVLSSELAEESGVAEQVVHEVDGNASVAGRQNLADKEAVRPELVKQATVAKVDARVLSDEVAVDEPRLPLQKSAVAGTPKQLKLDEANQFHSKASELREPIKLVSKAPVAEVDPTLLAAYEAFNQGDDNSAQQKYRLVLQKDVRNIDALLGMAAIAQRQGRNMDAIGWYRTVTEIEPRNSIAQSAMAALEANADGVGAESKIKSMLARQPDAAHLHAALGNLYAAQNQWASAQSAYFNASQYAPISADYAFNLAISLEHLGKPKLALVQYQRALDLLNITGATSPDRAQIEARVHALQ
jgi:Tfp pilus assembly protein PilF